jgi:hypothetical protein
LGTPRLVGGEDRVRVCESEVVVAGGVGAECGVIEERGKVDGGTLFERAVSDAYDIETRD